jgi:hypothetical protein
MLHDSLTFLLPLYSQIWLSALIDHSQPSYFTKFEKKKRKTEISATIFIA